MRSGVALDWPACYGEHLRWLTSRRPSTPCLGAKLGGFRYGPPNLSSEPTIGQVCLRTQGRSASRAISTHRSQISERRPIISMFSWAAAQDALRRTAAHEARVRAMESAIEARWVDTAVSVRVTGCLSGGVLYSRRGSRWVEPYREGGMVSRRTRTVCHDRRTIRCVRKIHTPVPRNRRSSLFAYR